MSAVKPVLMSDEVQRAVAEAEDFDDAYALLEAASDGYMELGRPLTLAEVQERLRRRNG